jgi:CheY-like chemotaxis protein
LDGHAVATAASGEEGLDLARRLKPSLITLDIMMPGMDGFDFVLALRQHQENQSIPIIVVTAKDLTDEDHRRLDGGVQYVIARAHSRRMSC